MTEVSFEEVCKTIEKTMSRHYRDHLEWEDAVQEAKIQAWKDWDNGLRDVRHLVNRARMCGKGYFSRDKGRRATGHAKASRVGHVTAAGDATRAKVQQYVEDYIQLHDAKPKIRDVAKAIGLSETYASGVMRTMHQRKYAGEQGSRDNWADSKISLDSSFSGNEEDLQTKTMIKATSIADFTDDIDSDSWFLGIIQRLQDWDVKYSTDYAELIFLRYYYDMTPTEIGKHWGYTKNPGQRVANQLARAKARAEKLVYEDESADRRV